MTTSACDEELSQREEKFQVGQTVTVRNKPEDDLAESYHPKKWQSNITILSCVSVYGMTV
jgi:hypothetical protein